MDYLSQCTVFVCVKQLHIKGMDSVVAFTSKAYKMILHLEIMRQCDINTPVRDTCIILHTLFKEATKMSRSTVRMDAQLPVYITKWCIPNMRDIFDHYIIHSITCKLFIFKPHHYKYHLHLYLRDGKCTGLTINMEYFQATHLLTHKLRKLNMDILQNILKGCTLFLLL